MNMRKIVEAFGYYRYLLPYKHAKKQPELLSIFGISRGGTTWLAEILASSNGTTLVWEPFFRYRQYRINFLNPFAYPEQVIKGIGWTPYVPENEEFPELEEFCKALFSGRIVNLKIYRFNRMSGIGNTRTLLFKFCFANMLLPWLVKRFSIRPVLLVRNPYAVVASSLNFGKNFDWHKNNPVFRPDPNNRYNSIYSEYDHVLPLINSPEALLAFQWSVQYRYLLEHPLNNSAWLTIAYEDLYLNFEKVMPRIMDRYELKNFQFTDINRFRRSFSSGKSAGEKEISEKEHISRWRTLLSEEQIKNVHDITVACRADYYGKNDEADYNRLYNSAKLK